MRVFWVGILFVLSFSQVHGKGSYGQNNASNIAAGANGAYNADEALKRRKKCQQLYKAKQYQQAQQECQKSNANMGQMLGSLGQLMQGLMALASKDDSSGAGIPGFSPLDFEAVEDPVDILDDPVKAQSILGGVGLSPGQIRDVQQALALADQENVAIDDQGNITSSSGTIPASALSSPGGLASLGFTPSEIADINKKQAAIADELKGKFKDLKLSDGGGGGSGSKGFGGAPEEDFNFDFPSLDDGSNSLLAQLGHKDGKRVFSKNYGDSRIGVQGASIFESVSRRYQIKRRSNYFLP